MREIEVVTVPGRKLGVDVRVGRHSLVSDEPESNGGEDLGPVPHDLLVAALGTCTAMTLEIYAARKGWPLQGVRVVLGRSRSEEGLRISRRIEVSGPLDDAQRQRLLEIAEKCPVHRTLTGKFVIASEIAGDEVVNPDVGPTS